MAYHAAFEVDFYHQTAVEFSHSLGRKRAFYTFRAIISRITLHSTHGETLPGHLAVTVEGWGRF
jgi:hypothetical protein